MATATSYDTKEEAELAFAMAFSLASRVVHRQESGLFSRFLGWMKGS